MRLNSANTPLVWRSRSRERRRARANNGDVVDNRGVQLLVGHGSGVQAEQSVGAAGAVEHAERFQVPPHGIAEAFGRRPGSAHGVAVAA